MITQIIDDVNDVIIKIKKKKKSPKIRLFD